MSTPANITPGASDSRTFPQLPAGTHPFLWSVRRELWESRSVYLGPLLVAVLFFAGHLISLAFLPAKLRAGLDVAKQHDSLRAHFDVVAFAVMAISFVVALIYCLDALYGERRDRSILFWKSLPVSDATAVLAKASIPIVVIPVVTLAVIVVTHLLMLLAGSVVLLGSGIGAGMLWRNIPVLHMWWELFVHMVTGHGLWYAPFYGWLLLVSAWARRAPLLWATLPPAAVGFLEKIAFNTTYFGHLLEYRLTGGPQPGAAHAGMSMEAVTPFTLGQMLTSPGLWLGLALTAAFLWGAVWLRRQRGPN